MREILFRAKRVDNGEWTDEITKALRWLAKETEFAFAAEQLNAAATLIESLQSQLAACQRRERAAVEFIQHLDREYSHYISDRGFEQWRGPQEAREDDVGIISRTVDGEETRIIFRHEAGTGEAE